MVRRGSLPQVLEAAALEQAGCILPSRQIIDCLKIFQCLAAAVPDEVAGTRTLHLLIRLGPGDAGGHEPLEAADALPTTLNKHNSHLLRAKQGDEEPCQMQLLRIHQYFEPVLRLVPAKIHVHAKEQLLTARLALRLRLALLLLQLRLFVLVPVFIFLLMVVLPLLYDRLCDDFRRSRIVDRILRHDHLVVAHFDLRQRCRRKTQLDSFLFCRLFRQPVTAR